MHIDGGGHKAKAPTKELGFKKLDKNSDGKLDAEELKGSKKFAGFDKDKNGEVTRDEAIVGAKAKEREDRLKQALAKYDKNKDGDISGNEADKVKIFDTDKDGKITKEEIKAGKELFDKDNDGKITQEEFKQGRRETWKKNLDDKFEKAFAKLDGNKDKELTGSEAKKYEKWDKDGDGKVTKEEFKEGKLEAHKQAKADREEKEAGLSNDKLGKRFGKLDGNKDGWLSGNESNKHREQFDRDGDGEITKKEFIEGRKELAKLREEAKLVGDDPSKVRLEKKEEPKPPRTGGPQPV